MLSEANSCRRGALLFWGWGVRSAGIAELVWSADRASALLGLWLVGSVDGGMGAVTSDGMDLLPATSPRTQSKIGQ